MVLVILIYFSYIAKHVTENVSFLNDSALVVLNISGLQLELMRMFCWLLDRLNHWTQEVKVGLRGLVDRWSLRW